MITTDRYSHAIKWSNVRDYGVRKAAGMSSDALTFDGRSRVDLHWENFMKDPRSG